ncbi:hypothetical protein OEZ86_004845 [Tetradesmus obliquus]|nr:hypothetical protein OEZ86_004845 [Tetradesmus obliquus]
MATGYLFSELMMWWTPGEMTNVRKGLEPTQHFENVETKRRFNNLIHASGLIDKLQQVEARTATVQELCRVHTQRYVEYVQELSKDSSKGIHKAGPDVAFGPGGYEIAALAAGGSIAIVDAALDGSIRNGYALVRPPGHHACADQGMGFCVFNNIAVAAAHALEARGLSRIAIVDYDVHHGNGTQEMFWEDDRVLFISIHQDSNYPLNSGPLTDTGSGKGSGTTINVPLPPGSGSGAYRAVFDRVVVPALDAFEPQLVLVSSGFDASFFDPLAQQMCTSEDYRYFTQVMSAAADRHCSGRLLYFHEGGYSAAYVPFCGLAVMEQLSGHKTQMQDVFLGDTAVGGQALQPWQDAVIGQVGAGPLTLLRQKVAEQRQQ